MRLRLVAALAIGVAVQSLAACDRPAPAPPDAAAAPSGAIDVSPRSVENGIIEIRQARSVERADEVLASAVLTLDETRTARIGSVVDGIVIAVQAEVGDRVRAGTILGALHSHVVHDAWAAYRKAVADRRRQENEAAYTRQNEARADRLVAAKALSPQEAAKARVDRMAAEEALEIARTEVRRSEEELEHLGITNGEDPSGERGEQIPIRTPGSGVVLERLVTPGTAVTVGAALFVISDLSQLWAVAEIDEARLSSLAVGRDAALEVPAYPGERFPSTVTFIGDTVNPATRRVTVRSVVANRDGRLKPQMYASVRLGTSAPRQMVVVPVEAVQDTRDGPVVFVAEGASRFRPRAVVVGTERDGEVEIRQGLRAGERIAAKGSFLIKSQAAGAAAPGA